MKKGLMAENREFQEFLGSTLSGDSCVSQLWNMSCDFYCSSLSLKTLSQIEFRLLSRTLTCAARITALITVEKLQSFNLEPAFLTMC